MYPIILAHGIFRFDKLLLWPFSPDNDPDDSRHYFKGIRSLLMANGYTVFHSSVNWGGSVAERAKDLRDQLNLFTEDFEKYKKVHIIAHSMGGLDAREMLFTYKMYGKVASLTTIGTPHHGSPFADLVIAGSGSAIDLLGKLQIDIKGIQDLTTGACRALNAKVNLSESAYQGKFHAYAGNQSFYKICLPLQFSHAAIFAIAGDNDGLVPVDSAKWDDKYFAGSVWNADHLNELGWSDSFGIATVIQQLYLKIARQLKD